MLFFYLVLAWRKQWMIQIYSAGSLSLCTCSVAKKSHWLAPHVDSSLLGVWAGLCVHQWGGTWYVCDDGYKQFQRLLLTFCCCNSCCWFFLSSCPGAALLIWILNYLILFYISIAISYSIAQGYRMDQPRLISQLYTQGRSNNVGGSLLARVFYPESFFFMATHEILRIVLHLNMSSMRENLSSICLGSHLVKQNNISKIFYGEQCF